MHSVVFGELIKCGNANAEGIGPADVDGKHLLLFQSQEAKHAWNLSELSDQEAWSATLVLIQKLTADK